MIKQPPNPAVMSFIKASTKGGEYERDVNATDAALDKGKLKIKETEK